MSDDSKLIPCDEHTDDKCGLCNGSKYLRLETLKDSADGSFQIYVPSNLTQEQAQLEYDRSIDILLNNFKLSN